MLVVEKVVFIPHDFEENYRRLLSWAFIADENMPPREIAEVEGEVAKCIEQFTIISRYGELQVNVGPGKYKSGILLYYLALLHRCDCFDIQQADIEIIRNYFSQEIIADAEHNPDTKHTTVRALLALGVSSVRVVRH